MRNVKVVMHGVTGRMGKNQHLLRSIMAIRKEGGVPRGSGDNIMPEPILTGRDPRKLEELAADCGGLAWSTDVDALLADPEVEIFFDAGSTQLRASLLHRAIAAGKSVYCEKPSADTAAAAADLYRAAAKAGVKHGAVQDKLWLPGLLKLKRLVDSGFFGQILSVKIDFGYWVFVGDDVACQRPSWNYRKEDGGGIILDMLPHWHYVIQNLFGEPGRILCHGATHVPRRWDEQGKSYAATAEDAFYAIVETRTGVTVQINSSWTTRVRRDDLVTFQVDGTHGSAVAGLTDVRIQPLQATPRPVWNPDQKQPHDFFADWQMLPTVETFDNAFKAQWSLFLKHVVDGDPFPWDLHAAALGVAFAETGTNSWREGRWLDTLGVEGAP